ncbi:hypothetical protein SAY86_006952 [Trapa natans]|uniref:BHLH domain-containing protein n=1 Tax=Trapa natans TaxID=22666 RepID=A0AAN7L7L3_TRANT|nr:hypothetical protein SAY86_006952 [Trapa natans]
MELPHSRPIGGEENFLKTHDFLGKTSAREEVSGGMSSAEKLSPSSKEHLLPGGIGTYSISHISHFDDKVQKPEAPVPSVTQSSNTTDRNNDNSNCSSYSNSGFTLWEESTARKVERRERICKLPLFRSKVGPLDDNREAITVIFHQPPPQLSLFFAKKQSFMDMIKSAAKAVSIREEELGDEEDFVVEKETSLAPGDLRVKINDQKANTPRSKHSATEQRRRSKISDRFQKLRALLPQNEQKRDKASSLLEVIEYIQILQEKVQKYEGPCPAERMMTSQRSGQTPVEAHTDHSRVVNGGGGTLVFAKKVAENNMSNVHDTRTSTLPLFQAAHPLDSVMATKGATFPVSLQPDILMPVRTSVVTQPSPVVGPDMESKALQPQSHKAQSKPWLEESTSLNDKLAIKGGTISISSAYSRGLLDTLTETLRSSGVDLSQASISVQIELGKKAKPSTDQARYNVQQQRHHTTSSFFVHIQSSPEEAQDRKVIMALSPKSHIYFLYFFHKNSFFQVFFFSLSI